VEEIDLSLPSLEKLHKISGKSQIEGWKPYPIVFRPFKLRLLRLFIQK